MKAKFAKILEILEKILCILAFIALIAEIITHEDWESKSILQLWVDTIVFILWLEHEQ